MGDDAHEFEKAAVTIIPVPYEGGISYGSGAAEAPEAIIEASPYLEMYDEVLELEPYLVGISTLESPLPERCDAEAMVQSTYEATKRCLDRDKFVVCIGGDHSITNGCFKALLERYTNLSVIQFDAHTDLRDSYEGSALSHACTMARIREHTQSTLQIGSRSISAEEALRIKQQRMDVCTMHAFRHGRFPLAEKLSLLADPVFITFDLDVFDWSVIASTGTPEPGGFLWDETMELLQQVFEAKRVVGFDVVELSHRPNDSNSAFAAAKLIYKMIGFKLVSEMKRRGLPAPTAPMGPFFK